MQILITDSSLVRSRALHIRRWHAVLVVLLLAAVLMAISGLLYHVFFVTAAREGWPMASQLVKLMVRDELAQRERVMRENLDAIALRVGEMQAKLVKLEQLGERVTDMARVKTDDLKALPARAKGGQGGPFVPLARPTVTQINEAIDQLDERADIGSDLFTLVESRLFEARLQALLVPSSHPVDVPVGSGFGFRIDPITGRAALHTGLDFPSDVGTAIHAAAGGMVVVSEVHPAYGNMIEIDHGNSLITRYAHASKLLVKVGMMVKRGQKIAEVGTAIHAAAGGMVVVSEVHPAYGNMIEIDHGNSLITRYAHASKLLVKVGMMVKRGQKIAEVGTSGRSTGPHLHFEVLLAGVQQNPARFLAGKVASPTMVAEAAAPAKARKLRRRDSTGEAPTAWASDASAPAPDADAAGGAAAPSNAAFGPPRVAPSPEGADPAP